jgi:agmatine deiminase
MPAEWAPHEATWVAWPSHEDLWQDNLAPARAAFVQLVAAIAEGETAEVLVPNATQERLARAALPSANVRLHHVPFGDIWLRDTAPIFLCGPDGQGTSVRFAFNGWGGKYVLEHDDRVAERIAAIASAVPANGSDARAVAGQRPFAMPFVLEGGAVEVDGEGSALVTRQCLLHPNRNGSVDEKTVEGWLRDALGVERVLWFGEGLVNDHTDGHIDTLVRFVRPGVVVAMEARRGDDPNENTLETIVAAARRHGLRVEGIPSPGRVVDGTGRVMPASYVNFYVCNACVVVPTYGAPSDEEAVERIGELFPDRRAVKVDARAILTGGGAIHCITQQQPRVP